MSEFKPESNLNSPIKRGVQSGSQTSTGESPIKSRLSSSFWKKRKVTDDAENVGVTSGAQDLEYVNINQISNGKSPGKAFVFRVSLIGHVTEAAGGMDGCLKFHGMDSTGEICIFVYKTAQKVANQLKVNGVYKLQNFDARPENPNFPQYTGSTLQVVMNETSVLEEWSSEGFPPIPFNFVDLSVVPTINLNTKIDVLGIITGDWGIEPTQIGKPKRDIRLTDKNKDEVLMTLWEENAAKFSGSVGSPIALRKAVVREFKGDRLLNAMKCTLIWLDPDLPEGQAKKLVDWFEMEKESMEED